MLDIVITHYQEPWEVCKKQFWMLEMQRGISWDEIRVTIVNDGGHELPQEELDRLTYPIWKINIPHGGISAARNAGIEHTSGDWIMFCDCDDCLPGIYALKDIMNVIHSPAAEKYDMMWNRFYQEDPGSEDISLLQDVKVFVFIHGKVYRRAFLEKEKLRFDESLGFNEDSCFNATILARTHGHRIGEIKSHAPVYAWIRRDDSLTHGEGSADKSAYFQFRRNLIVTEEHRQHSPDEYPGMVTRTAYDAYYMTRGRRYTQECKKRILEEFTPWIAERADLFGQVDAEMLKKIQGISRFELADPDEELADTHEHIAEWVRETAGNRQETGRRSRVTAAERPAGQRTNKHRGKGMDATYRGTATLNDGRTVETTGTIMECADWSEDILRENGGQIEIRIDEIREGGK